MAESKIFVKIDTYEQLSAILGYKNIDNIIMPIKLMNSLVCDSTNNNLIHQLKDYSLFASLPNIIRANYREQIINFINGVKNISTGFLASSYDALGLLVSQNIPCNKIIADHSLYSYNDYAIEELKAIGCGMLTIPLELKKAEISHRNNSDSIMIVYGHAPYMIMAQCMNKNNNKCTKKSDDIRLTDRMGKKVFVKNYCDYCYNILYNPMSTDLISEISYLNSVGINYFRLDFTVESSETIHMVLEHLSDVLLSKSTDFDSKIFTRGHYKNGVE